MKTYHFALLGAGNISPTHAQAIAKVSNARLVAVCDLEEAKARECAASYGGDVYTDAAEMLQRADIDVVNIITWSGTHADLGMMAARAGKHVICTKPMDVRLDKIDALIRTCRECGVKLGATHQYRSYAAYKAVKKAIDDGRFGRLLLGNAFLKWWRSMEYYSSADWRGTWELDGGGALMNQGIHYVDMLTWLMGPVAEIRAFTDTLNHEIAVEDIAVASLKFRDGGFGTIQAATCISKGLPARIEIHGSAGNVIIENDRIIHCDLPGGIEVEESFLPDENSSSNPRAGLAGAVEAHAIQIRDVLAAIEENRDPILSGAEARRCVEIILGVYESSRTGESVKLG